MLHVEALDFAGARRQCQETPDVGFETSPWVFFLRRAVLAMAPQPRPANWRDAAPLLMPAVCTASWANAMTGTLREGGPAAVPFGNH